METTTKKQHGLVAQHDTGTAEKAAALPEEKRTSGDGAPVRRRSSMRKSRSETAGREARIPTQKRSRERLEKIIAATEALLQTANIEDISSYDVAAEAGISPASVNYLFPTMSALWIEMSQRYFRQSTEHVLEVQRTLAAQRNPSWQGWMRHMAETSRVYFNANRHVSEVCLGARTSKEVRLANIAVNVEVGDQFLNSLREVFILPEIPDLTEKMALAIEACDAVWSRCYVQYGHITEEANDEMVRMQVAFLRCFLPETLPIRPEVETRPLTKVD